MEDNIKLEVSASDDLETAIDKALEQTGGAQEERAPIVSEPVREEPKEEIPPAPAEFNKEEKEAWERGDRKGIRQGWDRVNQSRLQEMYKKDTEYKSYKELASKVAPYIESSGLRGKSPETAIIEALALLNESQKDPWKVAEEIAKVRNIPRPTNGEVPQNNAPTEEFKSLQEKLESLVLERETEKTQRAMQHLGSIYQSLQSETIDGNNRKYPGLDNDELAVNVGSLIRSMDFQRAVLSRIPNAGPRELIIEAYKWYGGEVVDSNGVKSLNNNNHNERARKASISQPGRSVPGSKIATRKYSNIDDALDAAMNDLKS